MKENEDYNKTNKKKVLCSNEKIRKETESWLNRGT
jgi:hypothetical protein